MWPILAFLFACAAAAQTPADLYALEEYHAWLNRQTEQVRRDKEVLDRYRTHLVERGMDHADADSQILAIREQEAEQDPPDCLADAVKGLTPGRAFDDTGHGPWLARRGWKISAEPLRKGKWNLIIVQSGKTAPSPPQLRTLLQPGGVAIRLDGRRCSVTK